MERRKRETVPVLPKNRTLKTLHSQAKELVLNVYEFMSKEAKGGPCMINQVEFRVAKATSVSRSTVQRVLRESKSNEKPKFHTSRKHVFRKIPITDIDGFSKSAIRETIYKFLIENEERLSSEWLLRELKKTINFEGSSWSLRVILNDLGFISKKTVDNRKVLIERSENRELRLNYLRAIQCYRELQRPIVYTDEMFIHASQTKSLTWSDGSDRFIPFISKSEQAVIIHAGHEGGFIKNALLIFKPEKKSIDGQQDTISMNYEKWFKEKLIPNLPPNSVVVFDNSSYHNVEFNRLPTSTARKVDMIEWLQRKNIPFSDEMLKPELYRLIQLNEPSFKTYKIDSLLAAAGHSILRLPPFLTELNPIEKIWVDIKACANEKSLDLDEAISLVENKISLMSKDSKIVNSVVINNVWEPKCNEVRDLEKKYLSREPIIDVITEGFGLRDSDSDAESDNSANSVGSDNDELEEMEIGSENELSY